jgi:hypothetical protein
MWLCLECREIEEGPAAAGLNMKKMMSRVLPVLAVVLLTGVTLTTTVLGAGKILKNYNDLKIPTPEVKSVQAVSEAVNEEAISEAEEEEPTPTPITSNQCVITLFGKQYDVTSLRSAHSGGNVFVCGTDQTTLYQSQHGTNMSRMQAYLVTNGVTPTPTPGISGSRNKNNDDEDDDEEERGVEMGKRD